MANEAMNSAGVLLLIAVFLSGCVIHLPENRQVPAVTARAQGLVAHIDFLTDFSPLMGERSVKADLTIRNESNRALIISPYDVTLIDAEGFSVSPQETRWFNVERLKELRKNTEVTITPGSEVLLWASFPQRVDFDRLSVIRIRSYTGGITVEIPLAQSER